MVPTLHRCIISSTTAMLVPIKAKLVDSVLVTVNLVLTSVSVIAHLILVPVIVSFLVSANLILVIPTPIVSSHSIVLVPPTSLASQGKVVLIPEDAPLLPTTFDIGSSS